MKNYYNNPRPIIITQPQPSNMSMLFICKCIFYYKSKNVCYYFDFIFGKYSPKYLFEYWGSKVNIVIEYTETKWYIKLTKFGYYRVVRKYRILYKRGWSRPDLSSICRFGGHLNLNAQIKVR